ncbi:MAG: hypothetical protein HRF49_05175 [bacterium]|jgi:uroporphyrinogen decarboxylase
MAISKTEIVDVALSGGRPARIPFSCWYHFGLQHESGKKQAEIEIAFFRHYDLDFLKVMDDFGYPFPDGFEWFRKPEDYEKLTAIHSAAEFEGYRRQLECLSEIKKALSGEAYFVNTIFSPFTWLRNYGRLAWRETMREHPDKFLSAMEIATSNIVKYVAAQAEAGVDGIFYSQVAGDPEFTTEEEFERYVKPFDIRILNAVRELPFNILHAHGEHIYIDLYRDYPVKVVNYSDRFVSNPSLDEMRRLKSDWCLMGGIGELDAKESDPRSLAAEIEDAFRQTGGRGWICTPGCSLKTNIWESHIFAMRDAVRNLPA